MASLDIHGVHPKVQAILKRAGDTADSTYSTDTRLHLTAGGDVVEEGHPDAAFLLAPAGGAIPQYLADELGLKGGRKNTKKAADAPASGLSLAGADGKVTSTSNTNSDGK